MYRWVRGALFKLGSGDAEIAHTRVTHTLARIGKTKTVRATLQRYFAIAAPRTVFGVHFPNPVGLAAGMDKDGIALNAWPALGFGYVEVGTVTWHPQPGNPRPRLWRLPASQALINRMGFGNSGANALAQRLETLEKPLAPLGISIGKSKITPLADAVEDYLSSFRVLYQYGDYFAINVSSPNTPELRKLQDRGLLDELITELQLEATAIGQRDNAAAKPLLVKIAPDLSDTAIIDVLDVCIERGVAGVIATNTTVARTGINPTDAAIAKQSGGLSGQPLRERAREVVRFIHRETSGALPIIGVGGIGSVDDGLRMLDAGASLIQIFTGLIYTGPNLIRNINRSLPRQP